MVKAATLAPLFGIARAHCSADMLADLLRTFVVTGCGAALALAGMALPFA